MSAVDSKEGLPQRLSVKFFFKDSDRIDLQKIVPVFHGWIQNDAVGDLLLDVHNYTHVPNGPGVMLVADEAHYRTDAARGRLGLLYARKRHLTGDRASRLESVFKAALDACVALEGTDVAPQPSFETSEVIFRIEDRLLAPNTEETLSEWVSDLKKLVSRIYDCSEVRLDQNKSDREVFEVAITPQNPKSVGVSALRARVDVP